ncbi:hypothetical protein HDG34_006136 [Paraburkholderia sp. HC6.4b]|uniref:type IV toxin-antitoxin system AbiEi family antitoxin domain-containing protein n=1 Tax=unclassified Paraburkholderia TaxID=2615204 RepID=UPI0018235797|nr:MULTISPECIES: AbiEi antitoxin N-terminal domain-containing protein [unclassified Paraburkholderia]MBB5412165.1 hypothetical protein [Paraburkholderia sp. HC6.4b]MBB5454232.1 hypothetical protein [Paraburkholderia sp. Kb1A]
MTLVDFAHVIQYLMDHAPRSEPLGQRYFTSLGFGASIVLRLVNDGWLRVLSPDTYLLRGDSPSLHGTLAYLSHSIAGLHVGGRAALSWRGVLHNIYFRERVDIWGAGYSSLPSWAVETFRLSYHPSYLFDRRMPSDYGLAPLPFQREDIRVSVVERAIIEHFAIALDAASQEDLQNLIASLRSPRPNILQVLSDYCVRRDVIQVIKSMGELEGYEWADRLTA